MKVGLLGCGKIGARHLDAYERLDDVEVLVADENHEQARAVAAQWNVRWVPPTELIGQGLDAIDVCVPSAVHKQWILDGLGAGLHVFCEKPLCLSYDDAKEIEKAADKADRNVIVGYLYRHHPSFQLAKETLLHGVIGDPHLALARLGGRGSHQEWKHDSARGGGAVFEMMVHMLDLLSWLFGPLTDGHKIYDDLLLPSRRIRGEAVEVTAKDCVVASLLAGNVRCLCQSDLVTPSFMNHLEIHGTNGSVMSSILDFMPTFVYCTEPRVLFDRGYNFREFPAINLFVEELGDFIDVVRSGEKSDRSLRESVGLARFIDDLMEPNEPNA